MLIDWYSKLRHSVNCKIMCRFPKKVLLVKDMVAGAGEAAMAALGARLSDAAR